MAIPECPVKFIFRGATRSHVDCQQKLLEIYEAIPISVKSPEHMITKLLGIPCQEAVPVYLHERIGCKFSVRTVFLESPVPCCDRLYAVVGVRPQELQVLPGQTLLL